MSLVNTRTLGSASEASVFFTLLALALFVVFAFWQAPFEYFQSSIGKNPTSGPVVYIALVIASIVIAPVATLPLMPFAVNLFGALPTALYSVVGWTIGGVMAFLIARHLGRTVLVRFVSLERLAQYEKHIPPNISFLSIVLLRMAVPVDILSYALGFLSTMPLRRYTLATLIGTAPFGFLFAYAGEALVVGKWLTLVAWTLLILIAFLLIRRFAFQTKKDRIYTNRPREFGN